MRHCVTVPNFVKIGQTVAEIWRFDGFQNGGTVATHDCSEPCRRTVRVTLLVTTASPTKSDKPIEVQFGWWTLEIQKTCLVGIELPDLPYFTGDPVFQTLSPASPGGGAAGKNKSPEFR